MKHNYAAGLKVRFKIKPLFKLVLEWMPKRLKIKRINIIIYSDGASLN
tara:strand:- start:794 stop:937 length:144 start_codon:yes stop_codon:yes gene_type:complete